MMRTVIVLTLVAACGGSTAAPDAALDAATTCTGLQQAFANAAATLDQSCNVDGDCAGIGGKGDNITCDCAASLQAFAVNGAAYAGSQADQIAQQFFSQCAQDTSVFGDCDSSPVFTSCSNHVCVVQRQSCLDFDAGP